MVQTINDLKARIYGIKIKDDRLFITVTDNGNGIPQKNLGKIFQPFFTTKPWDGVRSFAGLRYHYEGPNGE